MTLLVRDEEDVLDTHLRYHLEQGVDHFVVTDNLSTDSTPEILAAYAESGVATVIHEPEDIYAQGRWVTRMARIAADEHGADWVLHSDADEFLLAPGRSVRDALAAVPPRYGIVTMPRLNFRPRPDDDRAFHERLIYHETRPVNLQGRPLPPKVGHRGTPDAVVTQGNHDVHGTGLRRLRDTPIAMFHYPLRSYRQLERKVTLGGAAIQRNKDLHPNDGRRWVLLRERWLAGELPAWYESQVLHDEEIAAALDAGDITRDTRLTDRLAGRADLASEAAGAEAKAHAGGLGERFARMRARLPR
jgi:Glycosyl transferase family 2